MAGLGATTAALKAMRAQAEAMAAAGIGPAQGRLHETTGFGSNPGALRMLSHVPEGLDAGAPLVVVLHGCTQTAEGYLHGVGWPALADRYGFVLLCPEQTTANNPNRCFNWFLPEDVAQGRGEAGSIRQMIERAVSDHGVDRRRIFVTGLSAGGAMTSALLAAYPDVFAGGAIIAGLPAGAASSMQEAFGAMMQSRSRPASQWGDLVRQASKHAGPWPKVSIWHGDADTTVAPANAEAIVRQWTDVHRLRQEPDSVELVQGYRRAVWRGPDGAPVVESYSIRGMGHGTPLATGGTEGYGQAGPFMLEVGISSSLQIAQFWGLTGAVRTQARPQPPPPQPRRPQTPPPPNGTPAHDLIGSVGRTITDALKAAGLMK